MKQALVKFFRDEEGATAIEYGLIAGLIAVVIHYVACAQHSGTCNADGYSFGRRTAHESCQAQVITSYALVKTASDNHV